MNKRPTTASPPATNPAPTQPRTPRVPDTRSQLIDLVSRTEKLSIILEVAKSMGSTRNLDTLLDVIVDASRRVVEADRCTIFIHDRDQGELWAKVAQGLGAHKIRLPIGKGIAGAVAESKEPLLIADAYADSRFNPAVDKQTGYRTRNILCVPMLDNEGEVSGVIQTLNKAQDKDFNDEDQELLLALGGQAAVAVENALLHGDIERLFEGFIKASVYAIEARDPTTSGHSERVAELSVGIADKLQYVHTGPYASFALDDELRRELRYAALLHDFGKVGVREEVLLKSNKLYPYQFDAVRQRFDFLRRSLQLDNMRQRFELCSRSGAAAVQEQLELLEKRLHEEMAQLDAYMDTIITCNKPTVLAEGDFGALQHIAAQEYRDIAGTTHKLLRPDEMISLSIPRGNLDDSERSEIESHVTYTFRFLSQIPWTRDLKKVPEYAYKHHEKLNGVGYPRKLVASEIPVQARIMTIADIYDALTASDRPYKRAVPQDKALDILHSDAERGALDKDLLKVFVEAKVYEVLGT